MAILRLSLITVLLLSGCTRGDDDPDSGPGFDGSPPDARPMDARAPDGGPRDSGGSDTGMPDGGMDAPMMDAPMVDAPADAPPLPDGAMLATWSTSATAHTCPDDVGMRFTYVCPPGGSAGSLWGTDVYTYDSSVCTAAVHSGRITLAAGGTIEIEIQAGLSGYAGSTRGGVTSSSYGSYTCSFAVVGPACLSAWTACGDTCSEDFATDPLHCGDCDTVCAAGASCAASLCACPSGTVECASACVDTTSDEMHCGGCGVACGLGETCNSSTCGITWSTSASSAGLDCGDPGVIGSDYDFTCPASGTAGSVWGTDTYTHDSSICTAAVHAGSITLAAGGDVTIRMAAGEASYTGSMRNGITSNDYGTWSCSYVFP
jgi:hypothetical protein